MIKDPPKPKHEHNTLKFPDGFLWGAATASYQVEGNNKNADWWSFETKFKPEDMRSGRAANQYELFEKDFKMASELGHNSHRLSIEWSRIEPKDNEFDQVEIDHYKKVLQSLKDLDFTVMLTLWHFTIPQWVADIGGWENPQTVKYFERFVKKIVPELQENVDLWITLNEPGLYVFMSYMGGDDAGRWPPQKNSKISTVKAMWNLTQAHKKAYKVIHSLVPSAQVGIANNIQSFSSYHKHSFLEMLAVLISDDATNHLFYNLTRGTHDFLGINYYFHRRYNLREGYIPEMQDSSTQARSVSDLGWEVYPEGIFEVLTDLSDGLPIYITECGIASTNDDRRTRFLLSYLSEVAKAIAGGVKVKGFFYWSLIDNFEWHRGYDPRFGLVEINYNTLKRTIRPSALVYKEIIKNNGIPHYLLKLLGHGESVEEVLAHPHDVE